MNDIAKQPFVAVIIVGFKNAAAVTACLQALSQSMRHPHFNVFVAENGGEAATLQLIAALTKNGGPCVLSTAVATHPLVASGARQTTELLLSSPSGEARCSVLVTEMVENRGYAGGVNGWLSVLAPVAGWTGVWVLNPDTEPTEDALFELTRYAAEQGKGMVASRLVPQPQSDNIQLRGLAWSRLRALTIGIDCNWPASIVSVRQGCRSSNGFAVRCINVRVARPDRTYRSDE